VTAAEAGHQAVRQDRAGRITAGRILMPTADSSGQRGQINEEGKRLLEAVQET